MAETLSNLESNSISSQHISQHHLTVQIRIAMQDPDISDRQLHQEIEEMVPQLRSLGGVQDVSLVAVKFAPEVPIGMTPRNIGGFLPAVLQAEVSLPNIMRLLTYLRDRLIGNRSLELTLKAPDGREFNGKASSQEDMEFLLTQAEDFFRKFGDVA
jgi:hypothetical protein